MSNYVSAVFGTYGGVDITGLPVCAVSESAKRCLASSLTKSSKVV